MNHLNNLESPTLPYPKDDFCQVWLNQTMCFQEEAFSSSELKMEYYEQYFVQALFKLLLGQILASYSNQ